MALKLPTRRHARRRSAAAAAAALAAIALVAVAAGCGGGSSTSGAASTGGGASSARDAAAFIKEITVQFSRAQSGRLWSTLHPADQAAVSRDRYMACQTNAGFEVQKFKVLESYGETIDIGGVATPSTAISVKVTTDDGVTVTTMHAVSLAGAWRWVLSPADYATYKQGKCPSSA